MKERILIEDALKHIHECEYRKQAPTAESLAGALSIGLEQAGELLARLESSELAGMEEGRYRLTAQGREYALHVIRAHRLYETYLARETGFSEKEWHHEAERKEHALSDAEMERMARRLGDPRFDPHGDPIPTPAGELPPLSGVSLLECPGGWEGRIAHIEDEPESVYAGIVGSGLAPGMRVRLAEIDGDVVRLNAEGRTIELSKPMAALITATELESGEQFDESISRLSNLNMGERASILGLSPACRGAERSRLLDLGVVPGTVVEMDMLSPSGNPAAYRIRGASIALRRNQAERILIKKVQEE